MNDYELEKVAGIFNNIKKAQRRAKMKNILKKVGKGALQGVGLLGAGAAGMYGGLVGTAGGYALLKKMRKLKKVK